MKTDEITGTRDINIPNGFIQFFGTKPQDGGVWNMVRLQQTNYYSEWCTAMKNYPLYISLHTSDNPLQDFGKGHAVFGMGSAQNSSGGQYLFVMDGWNDYGRFVSFDYYPYFFAYKIWVR